MTQISSHEVEAAILARMRESATCPVRRKSACGQPRPNTSIERTCDACGASFLGLAAGKTGERGIWGGWKWYCSAECAEIIDLYEVRCPDCNTLVATEHGDNAVSARSNGVTFPCEPCAQRRYRRDQYRGLRCNTCRTVIGYTAQPPVNMLAETGALCPDCYAR